MIYHNPKSVDETLKLLRELKGQDVVVLAGGTDVVPKINSRPEMSGYFDKEIMDLDKKVIVHLGEAGLKYIEDCGDSIVIGAMTTMTEVLESDVIDKVPVLKEAINQLAGLTIRNAATIGGNIMNASPAADSVTPLIAMSAKAVLASADGERAVALEKLFVAPGKTVKEDDEILKEIVVPVKSGKAKFIKFGRRKAESLSVVNGAAYAEVVDGVCQNAVIALGSVAPTPLRIKEAEDILNGKKLTDELIAEAAEKAAEIVKPIDDVRGSGDYRKKLVNVLVKRAIAAVSQ